MPVLDDGLRLKTCRFALAHWMLKNGCEDVMDLISAFHRTRRLKGEGGRSNEYHAVCIFGNRGCGIRKHRCGYDLSIGQSHGKRAFVRQRIKPFRFRSEERR